MRILVAPDSFKGSLTAIAAANAIERGVARALPDARVECCPLSDGGEGFASVVLGAKAGVVRVANVKGPLGVPVRAEWAILGDGETAVIESAAAIGLTLIPRERRAPAETTTAGVGELIREALAVGAKRIVVGLGGSATIDGGAGMAQSLGMVFDGAPTALTGGDVGRIRGIDVSAREPRLASVDLVAVTDVDNPLTGADGAARMYGPQKGASESEVAMLDDALAHLARITGDPGRRAGDGAAGGLGYGLRVFAGARLLRGIDFILEQTGFDAMLEGCDLVLTGEGRLDAQTRRGKVVAGVSERARARGVPVIALVGAVTSGAEALYACGLTAYFSLCSGPMTEAEAEANAPALLEALAANVVRAWAPSRRNEL
jgi:glycerate kinase